jgi:general stress protein YciG
MPTKASLKNLKPPFNKRDPQEQKEISRKGGIRSGEVRRERKRFKEIFELLLAKKSTNDKGETATIKEIIAINTVAKAVKGDLKAVEIVRDTIGEKLKANDEEKIDN